MVHLGTIRLKKVLGRLDNKRHQWRWYEKESCLFNIGEADKIWKKSTGRRPIGQKMILVKGSRGIEYSHYATVFQKNEDEIILTSLQKVIDIPQEVVEKNEVLNIKVLCGSIKAVSENKWDRVIEICRDQNVIIVSDGSEKTPY